MPATAKIRKVPNEQLDSTLRKLLKKYPQLSVIRSQFHKDEVELYCTVCKETLNVEQNYSEVSDLHYVLERGFRQGKPCIDDGSEGVRCGCGTEYAAIEEWTPY